MRLWDRYRPKTLADVIGQPPVRLLQQLVARPQPCCLILEGPPGCGKTSAAYALAHDLGCYDEDTWPDEDPPEHAFGNCTGLFKLTGPELTIDAAMEMFSSTLRLRYGSSSGFKVLMVEELERLSPNCQGFLKDALEKRLRHMNVIVVATSNGHASLTEAFLERFRIYQFSGGLGFQTAVQQRLRWIWAQECPGKAFPSSAVSWGLRANGDVSMRAALTVMEDHLNIFSEVA